MKFNFLKTDIRTVEILDFEKEIGVELVVEEHKLTASSPGWLKKWRAYFEKIKPCVKPGRGNSIDEALKDYCKNIREVNGVTVMDISHDGIYLFIETPHLVHTRKVEIPKEEKAKERLFSKDEVIAFAKCVWYNEPIEDYTKGLSTYFDEWKSLNYTLNLAEYVNNKRNRNK